MRFLRNRAIGHRTCFETLYDLLNRLHLFDRNRRILRDKIHQTAKGMRALAVIHHSGVCLELRIVALPDCLLQVDDGLRIVKMVLLVLAASQIMEADAVERGIRSKSQRIKGMIMTEGNSLLNFPDTDSADSGNRSGKIAVDDLLRKPHCLKDARRLIGLNGGNSHFRCNLYDTGEKRLVVILDGRMIILVQNSPVNQLGNALMGKIRVNRAGTKAKKCCDLVHISRLSGFQNNGYLCSFLRPDQVLLHGGYGKKRRHRHVVFIHAAVRQNNNVLSLCGRTVHSDVQLLQCALQRGVLVIKKRNGFRMEARLIQGADLHQIHTGQNRMIDLQHAAVLRLLIQKVSIGTNVNRGIRDHLLTQGIDRGIGNLGKQLLEIIEQQLVLSGEHGKRNIMSHRGRGLHAVLCHREDVIPHVLIRVAENLIELVAKLLIVGRYFFVRDGKSGQMQQVAVQPLTVRLASCIKALALLVRNDLFLLRIHKKDAARLQARLLHDMLRCNVENTDLRGQNQTVVICDVVAGGTKSVAVQGRTHHIAIGEQDCRRAVPGLHHRCIVVVEILFVLLHEAVVLPRLRYDDHHGKRKRHPVHIQEFQRVVQHRRVGALFRNDRENLINVLLHDRRGHGLFTGQHTVAVAADGIDFAVMRDHPVRMRAVPGRGCVGGEPGVHDGNRGLVVTILQIVVELPQLHDKEHALVNNGSGG